VKILETTSYSRTGLSFTRRLQRETQETRREKRKTSWILQERVWNWCNFTTKKQACGCLKIDTRWRVWVKAWHLDWFSTNAMLHNVSMDFGCRTCPGDVWHTSKNLWKQVLRDIVSCSANWRKELLQYTHSVHVWYIYLHCHEIQTHVGKYTIHGCYTFSLHQSFCSVVLNGCACIRRSSSAIFPPSVQQLQLAKYCWWLKS